ncbi:MAG: acyl--CoA ligase [Deltaproteobacteria bacterium]|nr:acyl--CoA ligase [Deltaproteobacteria bacterium]
MKLASRLRAEAELLLGLGADLGLLPALLAERWGDRPAIDAPDRVPGLAAGGLWTYADVEEATARLAAAHRASGVQPGDTVLLALDNTPDTLFHVFALARLGAVAAPVNARLRAGELEGVVRATRAGRALVSERLADHEALSGLRVLQVGPVEHERSFARLLVDRPGLVEARRGDPDRVAVLLCTSGTTGQPKAAALTSRGLTSAAGRIRAPLAAPGPDGKSRFTVLAPLPLAHVMGLSTALVTLSTGARLVHRPRFDAEQTLDLLEAGGASIFVGVPTMYADLEAAGADRRDLGAVRAWVSAADAMPPERARRFQARGAALSVLGRPVGSALFVDVYGMVELSGAAAVRVYPPSPAAPLETATPAFTLPGIEARVVDARGEPVGYGKSGELQFRGQRVLKGYRGVEGAGPDAAGWFSTGDLGRLGPGGLLALSGRQRDRLKVGGFSVFPAEVEATLATWPQVAEVAVVGLSDARLGERPAALVVPRGDDFDLEAFSAFAQEQVAGYRRPHEVRLVDALPRGGNGKIDRRAATEMMTALVGEAS